MKFATLLVLTAHKFSSFQVGGCLSLMRRNCPKVFSRKLTLPNSHALMLIIISIAIIMVSSLSAPWYVMYVHNPSNDRTYCNRPPGGNHIYLVLIFILFMSFFRRHDLPFGIAFIISDMLILLKETEVRSSSASQF